MKLMFCGMSNLKPLWCICADRVFSSSETTNHLYQNIAKPLVVSAVEGYNGTARRDVRSSSSVCRYRRHTTALDLHDITNALFSRNHLCVRPDLLREDLHHDGQQPGSRCHPPVHGGGLPDHSEREENHVAPFFSFPSSDS